MFFFEKIFHACHVNSCFRYNKYYPALHEVTLRLLQFFYDYFEDLLALITFAKSFSFLAGVVFKIFVIKNVFQRKHNLNQYDCYILNEIFTIKKSIFAYA